MREKKRRANGRRAATIKDVALEAGVSPMTVSRMINGKNIKQVSLDKIKKAIEKVNYQPNIGARRLSGGRTYQFLMVFNNQNIGCFSDLLIGSMGACKKIGYNLLIEGLGSESPDNKDEPMNYDSIISLIDQSRIDGLILVPPACVDSDLLNIVRERNIPCVRIAGSPARGIDLRVGCDSFAAAYDMGNHLISLGHTNLAIIKGPASYTSSALRYEGFVSALRHSGLELAKSNVKTGNYAIDSGLECALELLSQKNRPTAIFASNDSMAAGVLSAAQKLSIRVPEELSVAGFDGVPISEAVWPKLTTIWQPMKSMGEKAVELLGDYLRNAESDSLSGMRVNVMVDYQLKDRQSTGPCSESNDYSV